MEERTLPVNENSRGSGVLPSLVLYNDDINTFDHVIKSLVEICGHDPIQAEQCALIVHFSGSCDVKSGSREMLESMSSLLNAKGMKAEVLIT